MNFQKGIVKYGDRTDIECTYTTLDNVNYYLLELGYDHTLPNGNMIASTELVEAIDPMYHASHIGVLDPEGKTVIPFTHRTIRLIEDNILLAELATPISENVVSANEMKSDPTLATKLVSTPALVKDRLNNKMNGMGKYVFNDQFSEATIYDLDGNNLIDNEYYSFISEIDNKLYFSKNTVDGEIREYSILPAEIQNNVGLDDSVEKIDVSELQMSPEIVENAIEKEAVEVNNELDGFASIGTGDVSSSDELEEEVIPSSDVEEPVSGLEDFVPIHEMVEEPAPVEETVEEPAPVEEKVEEPAPVEEAVEEPAPVEEKVEEPTPVEEAVEEPTPVEEAVEEPTPVEEAVEEPTIEMTVEESKDDANEEEEVSLNIAEEDSSDDMFKKISESEDTNYDIDENNAEDVELDDEVESSSLDDMIHISDEEKTEEEDPLKDFEISADSIDKIEEHDLFEEDPSVDIDVDKYLKTDSIVNDVTEYMSALAGKYKGTVEEVSKLQKQNDVLRNNNDKLKSNNEKLKSSNEKYKDSLDRAVASRNLLADKSLMQDKKIEALTAKIQSLQNTVSKQDKIITSQMQQRMDLEKVLSDVRASLEDTFSYENSETYSIK